MAHERGILAQMKEVHSKALGDKIIVSGSSTTRRRRNAFAPLKTSRHAGDDNVSLDAAIRILTDGGTAAGIGREEERKLLWGNAGI